MYCVYFQEECFLCGWHNGGRGETFCRDHWSSDGALLSNIILLQSSIHKKKRKNYYSYAASLLHFVPRSGPAVFPGNYQETHFFLTWHFLCTWLPQQHTHLVLLRHPSDVCSAFFLSFLGWFLLLYCISQYQSSSRLWPSSWVIASFPKALNSIKMLEIPVCISGPIILSELQCEYPFAYLTSTPECFIHISHLTCFPISLNCTIVYSDEQIRIIIFISAFYPLMESFILTYPFTSQIYPLLSISTAATLFQAIVFPYLNPGKGPWQVYLLSLTFTSPLSPFSLNHFTVFSFVV